MKTDGRNTDHHKGRAMTMARLRFHAEVEKQLAKTGAKSLLVAVSGGADSVALILALTHIAPKLGIRIEAANCNFHLRGQESDRDSRFVEELCCRLGVRLHSFSYDTPALLKNNPGVSMEMLCRDLRYSDFYKILKEEGLDRIAVAHNADDDIETMLLFLMRGAGTRGLKGMEHDSHKVIRPLLGISRKEIEEYLAACGQDYVTDSSNLTSDYSRNFIRREVLPLLECRWPGARKSMRKSLSILKEESAIVNAHYDDVIATLITPEGDLWIDKEKLSTGVILRYMEPLGGNSAIAGEIYEAMFEPYRQRMWKISDGITVHLDRDRIHTEVEDPDWRDIELKWEQLPMTEDLWHEILSSRDHWTTYLPDGPEAYELRNPGTGDRMEPLGMKGSRLVSDIISDARLSSVAKSRVRVLCRRSDGAIVWVPGLKRSRLDLLGKDDAFCWKANLPVSLPYAAGIPLL